MFQKNIGLTCFVGSSDVFKEVIEQARQLKGHDANVLIEGESGTGKELLARFIHGVEDDPRRPFIAVNCAAIPDALIESELFGHEQGSFTNAIKRKIGKFELANGGDIFLDEICSLKSELQAKLLRVLQEKEFCRVGGTQPIRSKFRVISASNVKVHDEVAHGRFRRDFLYRVRVVSLLMPPLRERIGDLADLVAYFLCKYSKTGNTKVMTPAVMERLSNHSWPGNIRELGNLIQNLVIMTRQQEIKLADLPIWFQPFFYAQGSCVSGRDLPVENSLKKCVGDIERNLIRKAIEEQKGNVTRAAHALKISRSKLYYTLKANPLPMEEYCQ